MTIRPVVAFPCTARPLRPAALSRSIARLAAGLAAALSLCFLGVAPAGAASFLPPTSFSPTGTANLTAAAAPDGTAFVAWASPAPKPRALVAVHAPGGSWQTTDLGEIAEAQPVPLAVAADGTAIVLVNVAGGALQAVDRPPGGTFSVRHQLSATGAAVTRPAFAMNANGTAIASWWQSGSSASTTWTPYARLREAGQWDRPPRPLLPSAVALSSGSNWDPSFSAAINDAGRGAVGFSFYDGAKQRAAVALRAPQGDVGDAVLADAGGTAADTVRVAVTPGGAVGILYTLKPTGGDGSSSPTGVQAVARFVAAGSSGIGAASSVTPAGQSISAFSSSIAAGPGELFNFAVSGSSAGFTPGTLSLTTARAVNGTWGTSLPLAYGAAGANTIRPRWAVNAAGDRLLTWDDYTTRTVRAAFSPRGTADLREPESPATGTDPAASSVAALDAAGNAVVAYISTVLTPTPTLTVAAAGFDTAPPQLASVVIPPAGSAGTPLTFSAAATDAWSVPTLRWAFGDGGTATGAAASYAYGTPNAYTATVTATDDAGNQASASGPVAVGVADRDGDGVLAGRDCDDGNAGVRPGIRDIPGNGRDENCDGVDAAFLTLATTVRFDWVRTARGLRVSALGARGIRLGDTIVVRCTGQGCTRRLTTVRVRKAPRGGAVSLNRAAKGASLRAGSRLTVEVSREDYSTRITTWTVRRGKTPRQSVRCLIPGAKKTQSCA